MIEAHILRMIDDEEIPYSVIQLTRIDALERIKNLCLENNPPFEEGTDKGFKDAYLYLTILEYLENNGENIYLVTKDERLKQSFDGNGRVIVVKNFAEFEEMSDIYFKRDYFINRLQEEVSPGITRENIVDFWLNINDNWVLKIQTESNTFLVEVDFSSKEIIEFTDVDFSEGIRNLVNSGSFQSTHSAIAEIVDYRKYFSDEQITELLGAAISNSQIWFVANDNDVKEFFTSLYEGKSRTISDEIKSMFKVHFPVER